MSPTDHGPPGWDTLEHRGYRGTVLFDGTAGAFHGSVVNTRDGITFVGRTAEEVRTAFRQSVDIYLRGCASDGRPPSPPEPGPCGEPVVTHVPYHLANAVEAAAVRAGQSLGAWIADRVAEAAKGLDDPTPQLIDRLVRQAPAGQADRAAAKRTVPADVGRVPPEGQVAPHA